MITPGTGVPGAEDGPDRAGGGTGRPEQDGAASVGMAPGPAGSGHEQGDAQEIGGGGQEAGTPRTGLDPVDRVLAREDEISRLPVTERAAAYEDLHRELERILNEDPGKLPHGLVAASGRTDQGVPPAAGTPGGWLQR
ncbi:hypothetical protein CWC38_06870 [Kocuria tytonicola]|uniref:hypothetical protein n=1 Tax=Kocuria tytonicola TaxID=2055946 RepID=UPI000EF8BC57|nr:hypothetical protein [Kocuria tytonicola]RLZ03226.1 hypothetical protein CWC38_06870 [Kocuria tytonicola]